ncbi:hypothetical protein [Methylopila sp. M107]|uniref:hypothetical protein n=1 Tax=Methylopila sp. M107 TaxID=1101190 RepID=UPI00037F7011|nr:hypothetical protein [Methylopila sp. M107]
MRRGPKAGAAAIDYVAKARDAWRGAAPDWILALAAEASRSSGKAVADRLGYSSSVISTALANAYPGDLGRLEEIVRGALMGASVDCPELGEIGRDQCLREQREPFRATSAFRVRLFHACNQPGRCRHSDATAKAAASNPEPSKGAA